MIATGLMVARAKEAADLIESREGNKISCTVFDMHTIKPIDKEGLDEIFASYDLIVTVEEHNIIGGMGSAVAEYKATRSVAPRQVFLGFNDSFYPAGSQSFVLQEAGLDPESISGRIIKECDD